MNMTLFVDASFHPETRAAGWGSWAIRDDWNKGRIMGGPVLYRDGKPETSNAAELAGIALALWKHDRLGDLQGVTRFLLQCDNIVALALIKQTIPGTRVVHTNKAHIGKTSFKDHKTEQVIETIREIIDGRSLSVKHVKGHKANASGRFWVNTACDAEARKHMTEMRKKIEARAGCFAD